MCAYSVVPRGQIRAKMTLKLWLWLCDGMADYCVRDTEDTVVVGVCGSEVIVKWGLFARFAATTGAGERRGHFFSHKDVS